MGRQKELCFAIYQHDADAAFRRAAITWISELRSTGVVTADVSVMAEEVRTETDFKYAWQKIAFVAAKDGRTVREGFIFSHASKGDPQDGLELRASGSSYEDGTIARSEIASLPVLPWDSGGLLTLGGCNSGLVGTRGWAPANLFASRQGVTTIGQAGFAYFSKDKHQYSKIDVATSTVYLWAYERRRNAPAGSGLRVPALTFLPAGPLRPFRR